MKKFSMLLMFLFLSFSAFAKGKHYCKAITYDSCRFEYALVCMDGYIDGCLTQQTSRHKCVVQDNGPSCQLDIAILCPAGFRDGCEVGRTQTHVCVPVAGPACEADVQWECPGHFKDACDMR